jgi:aminoglycoside phosphotransferase (APT) family kinase protein
MFYSHRLGDISNAQVQAALDRFSLGKLVSTESIPFGLFGQNLLLASTGGEFVLRGAPHYDWQLPTEQYFANLLRDRSTVPVPWPYLIDTSNDIFTWPWGFAIMPKMPGVSLADPEVYDALTNQQRTSLAAAIGTMLGELQGQSAPAAGAYDPASGSIQPFPGGYVARAVSRARQMAKQAQENGAHGDADAEWLEGLLRELAALPEPGRYTVVHEDFNRNNMTADTSEAGVRIGGVFDLMTCHMGDGLADLARQFSMFLGEPGGNQFARNYVQSYLSTRDPLGPDDIQRSLLYLIDERMLVWEYFHRPGHTGGDWVEGQTLRTWLGGYLESWTGTVAGE